MVQLIKNGENVPAVKKKKKSKTQLPAELERVRKRFETLFNVKAQVVTDSEGKGKITIPFDSIDTIRKIMKVIDRAD